MVVVQLVFLNPFRAVPVQESECYRASLAASLLLALWPITERRLFLLQIDFIYQSGHFYLGE